MIFQDCPASFLAFPKPSAKLLSAPALAWIGCRPKCWQAFALYYSSLSSSLLLWECHQRPGQEGTLSSKQGRHLVGELATYTATYTTWWVSLIYNSVQTNTWLMFCIVCRSTTRQGSIVSRGDQLASGLILQIFSYAASKL